MHRVIPKILFHSNERVAGMEVPEFEYF